MWLFSFLIFTRLSRRVDKLGGSRGREEEEEDEEKETLKLTTTLASDIYAKFVCIYDELTNTNKQMDLRWNYRALVYLEPWDKLPYYQNKFS